MQIVLGGDGMKVSDLQQVLDDVMEGREGVDRELISVVFELEGQQLEAQSVSMKLWDDDCGEMELLVIKLEVLA